MGDKDPYPTLLGIDWAYDNYAVIYLKKYTMNFEAKGIKVVQPLVSIILWHSWERSININVVQCAIPSFRE